MYRRVKNKKGLSTVIGATFLIVINLTSLFFIFGILKNSILLAPGEALSCAEIAINHPFKIQNAILNSETNQIELTLDRTITSSNVLISSLDFKIISGEKITELNCGPVCGNSCSIQETGTKTFYLDATNLDNVEKLTLTVGVNSCPPIGAINL